VRQPEVEPVAVDYEMEKTSSGWKIYDVRMGDVNLVTTYRNRFAEEVRNSRWLARIVRKTASAYPPRHNAGGCLLPACAGRCWQVEALRAHRKVVGVPGTARNWRSVCNIKGAGGEDPLKI